MMKTNGNIQRDKESSLFIEECCSFQARARPWALFGIAGGFAPFVTFDGERRCPL